MKTKESLKQKPTPSLNLFQKVESSNIDSIYWEEAGKDKGNIYVSFLNGAIYKYLEVPLWRYQILLTSTSVGKYLNSDIKALYTSERLS